MGCLEVYPCSPFWHLGFKRMTTFFAFVPQNIIMIAPTCASDLSDPAGHIQRCLGCMCFLFQVSGFTCWRSHSEIAVSQIADILWCHWKVLNHGVLYGGWFCKAVTFIWNYASNAPYKTHLLWTMKTKGSARVFSVHFIFLRSNLRKLASSDAVLHRTFSCLPLSLLNMAWKFQSHQAWIWKPT